jgi:hypothetical protein
LLDQAVHRGVDRGWRAGGEHAAIVGFGQRLHPHARGAALAIAQLDRGRVAQVDDPAGMERAAVVDPDHHRRPLSRLVTRAKLGSGRVLCAAVKAYMSYTSWLEVRRPWNFLP